MSAVPAVGAGLLPGFEPAAAVLLGVLIASHSLVACPLLLRMGLLSWLAVITAAGGTLITDTLSLRLLAAVLAPHTGETATSGLQPLLLPGPHCRCIVPVRATCGASGLRQRAPDQGRACALRDAAVGEVAVLPQLASPHQGRYTQWTTEHTIACCNS